MHQFIKHLHSTVDDDIDNHCMINSNSNNNYDKNNDINHNIHEITAINGFILKCFIDSVLSDTTVHKDFRNLPLKIISIHVKIDMKLLVEIILMVNQDFKCSSDFIKCCVEILDMIEFYFDNIIVKNAQSLPMIYNIHEVIALMRLEIERLKNTSDKTGIYSVQQLYCENLICVFTTCMFYSCKIYRHRPC